MSQHVDISRLIERAQAGDVQAFEALIKEHLPSIRRYVRAYAKSQSEADDLAQDALVKVFTQLGAYKFQSSLNTWLYVVVKRACIDGLRRERRWWNVFRASPDAHDHDGVEHQVDPAQHDYADAIGEAHEKTVLWAQINQLSDKLRSPLVLCDIEGLSYEEVARIEGVPVGTVRSRLHRARAALREALGALKDARLGSGETTAAGDEPPAPTRGTFGKSSASNSNEGVAALPSEKANENV